MSKIQIDVAYARPDKQWVIPLTVTLGTTIDLAIKQSGIFQIEGVADAELGPLLGSYCPNLLFPFAREAISDIVGKGSFPQLLLQPINFDAVYSETMRKLAEAETTA